MSLMMIRMRCRDLDSEDMYVQVRRNLIADTNTVANQIKEREDLERKETIRFSGPAKVSLSFLQVKGSDS